MTESEVSSVGSLPSLGAMVGTAVAGVLIDKIGRQKGGVVLCLPAIVSLLFLSFSDFITSITNSRYLSRKS